MTEVTHAYVHKHTHTHTIVITLINALEEGTLHIRVPAGESRYYKCKENFIEETANGKILFISANYKILLVYLKGRTF